MQANITGVFEIQLVMCCCKAQMSLEFTNNMYIHAECYGPDATIMGTIIIDKTKTKCYNTQLPILSKTLFNSTRTGRRTAPKVLQAMFVCSASIFVFKVVKVCLFF